MNTDSSPPPRSCLVAVLIEQMCLVGRARRILILECNEYRIDGQEVHFIIVV